jgi:hypothetical protein
MPIVSVNIASPLPPRVQARRFHSSISAAIAMIDLPPDFVPIFCCRSSNSGFSAMGDEATAPFQRAMTASIGKWAN